MKRLVLILSMLCVFMVPAGAVSPDEMLDDPVLEERAREISAGLRCLVCQNQSIDDSDADLARDLRVLVRERLLAGDSNAEAEQYIVDRYGEYVLLNPRLGAHTLLLWLAGPLLLLAGLISLFVARRRSAGEPESVLSEEELAALGRLDEGVTRERE